MTTIPNTFSGLYEKKKDTLFLFQGKKESYRLDCREKIFPLKVYINIFQGSYEVYISKSIMRPDKDNYDMIFNTSNFIIHGTEEIQFLFFTFAAKSILKISIHIEFSLLKKEEEEKKIRYGHVNIKKKEGTEFSLMFDMMTNNEKEFFLKDLSNIYYISLIIIILIIR